MEGRAGPSGRTAVAVLLAVISLAAAVSGRPAAGAANAPTKPACAVGASNDNVLGMTQFLGNYNSSDAVWHDELPFFRQHGPITRLTMYRAFFYDGIWHDPGELKGLQFWYGPNFQPPIYEYKDGDANLIGARKPHIPQQFDLQRNELITKAEVQWDPISMRWVSFTTNKGRTFSWGFKDVADSTRAIAEAPVPGAYLAAVRALEGKPAPVSKKRYIIQLAFVWALPSCRPAGAAGSSAKPLEASRLAAAASKQGPASIYLLADKETVDLIPSGVEAANIIYDGVTVIAPTRPAAGAAGAKAPAAPTAAAAAAPTAAAPPASAAAEAGRRSRESAAAVRELEHPEVPASSRSRARQGFWGGLWNSVMG